MLDPDSEEDENLTPAQITSTRLDNVFILEGTKETNADDVPGAQLSSNSFPSSQPPDDELSPMGRISQDSPTVEQRDLTLEDNGKIKSVHGNLNVYRAPTGYRPLPSNEGSDIHPSPLPTDNIEGAPRESLPDVVSLVVNAGLVKPSFAVDHS